MKRRLILMRHAKSSWAQSGQPDKQRPLNARGRKDAPRMAEELVARGWEPDAVVCSGARRTRETWSLMEALLGEPRAEFEDALYLAGLREIRASADGWDDGSECVMVLGHNPGWSDAASHLSGDSVEMTTANCALLIGDGDTWAEALRSPWELSALLRPREPKEY